MIAQRRLRELQAAAPRDGVSAATIAAEEAELQKAAGRAWSLNLWLLFGILLAIAFVTAIVRALTEADGLGWLLTIPALPQEVGEFSVVLAPLVAVAIAIERLLETGFNWYEQSVKAVSEVVSQIRQPLDWIEEELRQAYDAAEAAAKNTGVAATPAALDALDRAEERLAKAEQRLLGWVKAPEYVAWKRAITIWVGLLVGLVVAVLADLGMLHTIGMPAPRLLDMLLTGLVIGAGPGPLHSIIGMLQGGKDALDKVAALADGKALREAAAAIRENSGRTP
jgi:hypothetical protein